MKKRSSVLGVRMSPVNIDISFLQRLNLPDSLLLHFSMLFCFDRQGIKIPFFLVDTVTVDH